MAAFAAGAAFLSAALALTTFALVHHYLLDQREATAVHETYSHARVLKRDLTYAGANLGEALSSLTDEQGTVALLYHQGEWYSASVSVGESTRTSRPASLPAALVKMVARGAPAQQRIVAQGEPAVVVGVPLASVHADYFEIHSLGELARTLDVLAVVLLSCSVATTIGGLLVGRWASGRLLRPLRDIADVAAAISGGALDQRLPPADDPDLAVLAASFNEMVEALEERIKRDAQVRLGREPRAALPAHDRPSDCRTAGGLGGWAPAGWAQGARPPERRDQALFRPWSRTCSRSRVSTPVRPTWTWRSSPWTTWSSTPWRLIPVTRCLLS